MKLCILFITLAAFAVPSNAKETDSVAHGNLLRAIEAAGGEARFKTIQAPTMWMQTGTYYGTGQGVPFVAQYATYWPKRWYRQWIEGQFAIGVAGDQVTLFRDDATQGQKLTGPTRKDALHQARLSRARLLYPLLEDDYTLADIPGVDVAGRPTVGIEAVHASGSTAKLYFDKQTFLLMKTQAKVIAQEMPGKSVTSETFFSDHHSFGGVKLPSKYKVFYDGKLFVEGETTAIKVHATIDPSWFGTNGPARVR